MNKLAFDVDGLPAGYRAGFLEFAQTLAELTAEGLLGLTAFGGWVCGDAFFSEAPARSVAVLKAIDLRLLDQLALHGARLGRHNIHAPLIMTPAYVEASCDVFPLELLEIQQTRRMIVGQDFFAQIRFAPSDLRLQCERELKGALIQLRQELLAAAGKHTLLAGICTVSSERIVRTLRGLLHVHGVEPKSQKAYDIVKSVAGTTGLALDALARFIGTPGAVELSEFAQFYRDVDTLAQYADGLAAH